MADRNVVVVLFEVDNDVDLREAERLVDQRLTSLRVLQQNDSTDYIRGTQDRIKTYTVVQSTKLLDAAL